MRIIARMNVGGPAIQITNMLNGLPTDLFEQRLYFGSCGAGEVEYISEIRNTAALHRIPGFRRAIGFLSELSVLTHLIREIKVFQPQIIHTHTAKAGLLGRLAAMLSGSRAQRIHTFHGHVLYGYFNPVVNMAYTRLERFLARHTDVIISVGPEVQADLLKSGIGKREKHRVIFPGIEVGERLPKSQAQRELGLGSHKLTVGFIGRFTHIKRIDRILELARNCLRDNVDINFVMAGEGPDYAQFRAEAEQERLPMTFLGWRADVERILSASDLLILTSDNEGTPIASIQASLLGVPTLATDVGSVHDIVIAGETGLLTPPTVGALYSVLIKLYENTERLEDLGSKAKIFAEREFSLTRFLEEYSELYRALAR